MSALEINPNRAGAPKPEELRAWSIVLCAGRAFIGRLVEGGEEKGMVIVADPFSYTSQVALNPQTKQIQIQRIVTPVEFTTVPEIACIPQAIIPLENLERGELEDLARYVGEAWAGREHIRKVSNPLAVDPRVVPLVTETRQ